MKKREVLIDMASVKDEAALDDLLEESDAPEFVRVELRRIFRSIKTAGAAADQASSPEEAQEIFIREMRRLEPEASVGEIADFPGRLAFGGEIKAYKPTVH
ncbi:MAG: hypothetical protein KGL39_03790 [Patescibacteria group bacterium]|nr:hypothetical protein [Patescibacteria group bacterium]